MTFEQYILDRFPLYREVNFSEIKIPLGEILKLHSEWEKLPKPIFTQFNHLKTRG